MSLQRGHEVQRHRAAVDLVRYPRCPLQGVVRLERLGSKRDEFQSGVVAPGCAGEQCASQESSTSVGDVRCTSRLLLRRGFQAEAGYQVCLETGALTRGIECNREALRRVKAIGLQ
ncbi:hypothetical protein E1956_41560 [Paraburkholderia pallida]|uniref:Uncharacterized protein n=1 Tax=Paraburkholderia pallida TaxID=2547399 RepID=A0A4P7DA58_9BURK|nr:hypothetical protein E1956_41560 [Paraburkholderia pallida]